MNIDLLERLGHLYVPEGLEAVAINFLPEGLPKLGELDALGTRRSDKLQHLDWAPLVVGNRPGWNAKGDASRTIVAEILDICGAAPDSVEARRSEEHTSELKSLMRISYAVLCLKKKKKKQ